MFKVTRVLMQTCHTINTQKRRMDKLCLDVILSPPCPSYILHKVRKRYLYTRRVWLCCNLTIIASLMALICCIYRSVVLLYCAGRGRTIYDIRFINQRKAHVFNCLLTETQHVTALVLGIPASCILGLLPCSLLLQSLMLLWHFIQKLYHISCLSIMRSCDLDL